jgi:undecaprenyl-diphosphatase
MLGQRGPATLLFLPFFFWVAWRRRSTAPLVMLVTALILLNVSVGVVKYAIGRVGPAHINDVHMIFAGGNIYPSGHVSNTVVLYGLIAWIAINHRKLAITAAAFLSVTVGLGTVYLDTHWFSDVLGGWIAGGLILLALPTVMPTTQRWADRAIEWCRKRWVRGREQRRIRAEAVPRSRAKAIPGQGKVTPVSSVARSHNFAATPVSFDALDGPVR